MPVNPQVTQHPTAMQMAFTPQGLRAAAARGANVYMGGLPYAPGAGRPRNPTLNFGSNSPEIQAALQRKMQQYAIDAQKRDAQKRRQ